MLQCTGKATDFREYEFIASMWTSKLEYADRDASDTKHVWYSKIESYWAFQKASVAGKLGGLEDLHIRDVNTSSRFLNTLSQSHLIEHRRALDVGAGIEIFTSYLMSEELDAVDILEQSLTVGRRIA